MRITAQFADGGDDGERDQLHQQLLHAERAGTLAQTPIFGPKRFLVDINLSKRTRITEATNLEFRWEVFNLFNNVNFDIPNTNIRSIGFGQILRTVSNPRLMQFALKLNF